MRLISLFLTGLTCCTVFANSVLENFLPIRLSHNDLPYVPRLVRGIQESRSVAGSLDPADKPRDVGANKVCDNRIGRENSTDDSLNLNWLNKNIPLNQNFYGYANGSWQEQNPIPPEYASWSAFHVLQEKTQQNIRTILLSAEKSQAKPGSIEQKVGDFYYSGMDEAQINKLGIEPLQDELTRIENIRTQDDLVNAIAHLHRSGVNVLFNFGSMQDFKDSNQVIAAIQQGGLGLPDRDYYIKHNPNFQKIRKDYGIHIANFFILLGDDSKQAHDDANLVVQIETRLAKASLSQSAQRDPKAIYHIMSLAQLETLSPDFSWRNYFTAMGHPEIKQLNVATPDFIKTMDNMLKTCSTDQWKIYLRAHLLQAFAPFLSTPFVQESFNLVQGLTGTKTILPRWKRVLNEEENALGFAIGQLYVQTYFSASAKNQALEIVKTIRHALQEDLKTLPWMTPGTRKEALVKLALMEERVGYPDTWRDYSSLTIDRGPYVLNVMRANAFLVKRDLDKIGKPVDRNEWEMSPQTINAYYNPSMNSINFPMGILQPPFFDPSAPPAVNYGSIGSVIGHEITHGFDDQGAQFDAQGNLNNWWAPEDLKKFKAATACIIKQFSAYRVNDDLSVQGELVAGEATADLGGITLAYHAFHESSAYKNAKTIHGLTPDQQFFLGMAHVWANNTRPEQARLLITIDPHPPARYRVNGTLANMPSFQRAFNIPDNSPMINKNRCVIW